MSTEQEHPESNRQPAPAAAAPQAETKPQWPRFTPRPTGTVARPSSSSERRGKSGRGRSRPQKHHSRGGGAQGPKRQAPAGLPADLEARPERPPAPAVPETQPPPNPE
ncbi:MAG: hypothetical protein PHG96_06600, partial [Kiritimatiellae bacterium]|nr:hypothetical protein [Kiritimatiellia bacterium]